MLGPRLSIVSSLESLQIVEKHSVVINLIVVGYQTSGTTDLVIGHSVLSVLAFEWKRRSGGLVVLLTFPQIVSFSR